MKNFIFILLLVCLAQQSIAQCKFSISGELTDADTKATITDASILITELNQSTKCNTKGYFQFDSICPGHYNIIINHEGCEPLKLHAIIKNKSWHQAIAITHAINNLENITVKGKKNKIINSSELKSSQLESTRGMSIGESLQKINGVSSLQTGTNIYKPIINGLHSSRILILNNGVRQEGQQWGAEHAPEIDAYTANKLTVIKGANTLQYGADAIGGIILVEPKLLTKDSNFSGETNLAIFSNNIMGVLNGSIEKASKKINGFAYRISGTAKKAGYARTPNYWLQNSGMQELNTSLLLGLQKKNSISELYYSIYSNEIGIFTGSHIGNVTDLNNAINNQYPPEYIKNVTFTYAIDRPKQKVQHQLLKIKHLQYLRNGGNWQAVVAGQFNWRREYDRKKFSSSSDAPQLDLGIGTINIDAIYNRPAYKNRKGSIGFQQMYQNNAYNYRLFIPNYQLSNTGIFAIEKYEDENIIVEVGLRFDKKYIFSITQNSGKQYGNKSFSNFSSNIGISTTKIKNTSIGVMASSTWRAPNMNEMYSDGLHHGAARIEKGDTNLVAEKAIAISSNLNYKTEKWNIDVNAYHKWINDFIYLQPSYPPQLTIRGAFPLFVFKQTNARLYGTDVNASYHFTHHFSTEAKISVLYTFNQTAKQWLINMPSNRYEASANYTFGDAKIFKNNYAKVNYIYVAQQKRVPASGNIEVPQPNGSISYQSDYLVPPNAYNLLGAEIGTQIEWHHKNILITATANNILNTKYREYLNAFRYFCDEMGSNYSIKLKIPF